MATPTSSSSQSSPPLHPRPPLFTAIPGREQEEEEEHVEVAALPAGAAGTNQHPTSLRPATPPTVSALKATVPKKTHPASDAGEHVVSYNKCRPSAREKTSVVPLDAACGSHGRYRSSSIASPGHNSVLKSFISALTWRSPRPITCSSPPAAQPYAGPVREEEWRLAATELSHRLIHATRKRDEALAEASRLKYSVAELEKKLARLERYRLELKSALDRCNHNPHHHPLATPAGSGEFPLEPFLRAVSNARSAVRRLSRSLAAQMRRDGNRPKAHDRLSQHLQQQDARAASSVGGSGLLFHLEVLLSRAFYEDFESAGFQRGGSDRVLDPHARAEANRTAYAALLGLSWDDVLSRGTRHYSEGFSRFCDRKMGEVAVSALGGDGWGAWPEPLLRAFFGAAKEVWLVHLLAWCGHPPVPIFRVDMGAPFDARYMEDVAAAGKARQPGAAAVREMVAPGFYVLCGVVKCRVLCMHGNKSKRSGSGNATGNGNEIGSTRFRVSHGRSDGRIGGQQRDIVRRLKSGSSCGRGLGRGRDSTSSSSTPLPPVVGLTHSAVPPATMASGSTPPSPGPEMFQ